MGSPRCPDEEFMQLFNQLGATELAKRLNTRERNVYSRRRDIERRLSVTIPAPGSQEPVQFKYPGCVNLSIKNGTVLVGGDLHIWPGKDPTCLRAFKKFVDDIKPDVVALNGDVLDLPKISRHPQNWEKAPDVWEELEAAQDHLSDIEQRCKRGARKVWPIGNHDQRFETLLANSAPQLKKVKGVHLADHFPLWEKAMSCMINYDIERGRTMIKHKPIGGGKHATYNNVKAAGTHVITNHLHAQNIRAVSDYRDFILYGVDTGCLADKEDAAFGYTENSPLDWREGFALLTFLDGQLMYPELITKWTSNSVYFRGQVIRV